MNWRHIIPISNLNISNENWEIRNSKPHWMFETQWNFEPKWHLSCIVCVLGIQKLIVGVLWVECYLRWIWRFFSLCFLKSLIRIEIWKFSGWWETFNLQYIDSKWKKWICSQMLEINLHSTFCSLEIHFFGANSLRCGGLKTCSYSSRWA